MCRAPFLFVPLPHVVDDVVSVPDALRRKRGRLWVFVVATDPPLFVNIGHLLLRVVGSLPPGHPSLPHPSVPPFLPPALHSPRVAYRCAQHRSRSNSSKVYGRACALIVSNIIQPTRSFYVDCTMDGCSSSPFACSLQGQGTHVKINIRRISRSKSQALGVYNRRSGQFMTNVWAR